MTRNVIALVLMVAAFMLVFGREPNCWPWWGYASGALWGLGAALSISSLWVTQVAKKVEA